MCCLVKFTSLSPPQGTKCRSQARGGTGITKEGESKRVGEISGNFIISAGRHLGDEVCAAGGWVKVG